MDWPRRRANKEAGERGPLKEGNFIIVVIDQAQQQRAQRATGVLGMYSIRSQRVRHEERGRGPLFLGHFCERGAPRMSTVFRFGPIRSCAASWNCPFVCCEPQSNSSGGDRCIQVSSRTPELLYSWGLFSSASFSLFGVVHFEGPMRGGSVVGGLFARSSSAKERHSQREQDYAID